MLSNCPKVVVECSLKTGKNKQPKVSSSSPAYMSLIMENIRTEPGEESSLPDPFGVGFLKNFPPHRK